VHVFSIRHEIKQSKAAVYTAAALMIAVPVISLIVVAVADASEAMVLGTVSLFASVFLAVGLFNFRPWARTFTLIAAAVGLVVWGAVALGAGDIGAFVLQVGYSVSIILLLTGQSTGSRITVAGGLFIVSMIGGIGIQAVTVESDAQAEGDIAGSLVVQVTTPAPSTTTDVSTTTVAAATTPPTTAPLAVPVGSPGYADFSSLAGLTLVGSAAQAGDVLRLTPSRDTNLAGATWFDRKQSVAEGFDTTFEFRIWDIPKNPGDGFAFVIQNESETALGEASFGIGYTDIRNSVAVEIDTTFQDYSLDPSDTHIGIHTSGRDPNTSHESASIGYSIPTAPITDGLVHVMRIEYVPDALTVFIDDSEALTVSLDLASTLDLDGGAAWVGFTASTEPGFREAHDIVSWTFTPVGTD
jgi:hypothetical protein